MSPEISSSGQEQPKPKSLHFKLTVFFLCTVTLIGSMDSVIVAACLPAIGKDLNGSSSETYWVGTSFLLAQTVTTPIYGTTSEIFGRKWPILIAISAFIFASILCATAKTAAWLIGARVVQGIGAGGMIQLVQIILSDITTMNERPLYMAFAGVAWALGTNIGIPIGGAIGAYTTWRWIFWINVPICLVVLVGLIICLQLQQDTSSFFKKLLMVDWLGLSVFTCASTLFLVGLTSGGVSYSWDSARVLAPLIVGLLLYPVFIYIEWRVAPRPMMPLRIFNDRSAITGYTTSFLSGLIIWCYTYYFILFFLGATRHGLLHAALETLSSTAYGAPAGIVVSLSVKKTRRFKYQIIVGWALIMAGMGSNVTMHPDSSKAILYAPRCLAAIGSGFVFPTPIFAVQARQRGEDIGIATSVQIFSRSLGTAFGVGLGGVIFQNEWTKLVLKNVREKKIPESLAIPSSLAEIAYEIVKDFPESVQEAYQWVYSDSFTNIWWVMLALATLGFLFSLTARNDEVSGGLSGSQNFQDKKTVAPQESKDSRDV